MILSLFSMNFYSVLNILSFGLYNTIKKDPTAVSLLISNLLTIFLAVLFGWNLIEVLWVYWGQSVIIGLFNFLKMLKISFSQNENVGFLAMSLFMSFFFLVHYNGFHLGYMIFLLVFSFAPSGFVSLVPINFSTFLPIFLITLIIFFVNHLFSFLYYSKKIKNYSFGQTNFYIGKLMFRPYIRIVPMHLTIIFGTLFLSLGFFNSFVLIFFLLLKTFADLKMHINEHKDELI